MPDAVDPQTEQARQAAEHGKPVAAEPTETPLEAIASMAYVVVIGLFIFAFVFQNFEIPSPSMEKTLLVGDHVMVDRVHTRAVNKMGAFCPLPACPPRRRHRLLQAQP